MGLQDEGTVAFFLEHPDADWPTNTDTYNFPTFSRQGITVMAVKRADKTLKLGVAGPLGQSFHYEGAVPRIDEKGLHVEISWSQLQITIYLAGKLVEKFSV